jgi:uncharacterized protein YdhG (YjbR/CyaY superfamily)
MNILRLVRRVTGAFETIRATIKNLPRSEERISYQIAAFELNGKNIIHFAGWKKHVSLYPVPAGDEAFEEEVSKYVDGKGTVKFPLDEPMPDELDHEDRQVACC